MQFESLKGKLSRTLNRLHEIRRERKKAYVSILFDFFQLRKKIDISFYEYYAYYLDDKTNNLRDSFLSFRLKKKFLSILNSRRYFILARNKYLAHQLFNNVGIRSAEVYLYYDPTLRVCKGDYAFDCESVIRILLKKNITECVIKTTEDSHGDGVFVVKDIIIDGNDCFLVKYNGEKTNLKTVLGKSPLLFEALIKQTTQMADFNHSSVNTIRFMTTSYPDGEAKVIATFIKIGREGACVDNAGDGGNVDAGIDVDTGVIFNAMEFNGFRKTKKVNAHPDSKATINGIKINNWDIIKKTIENYQRSLPFLKAAGWDVALTDDGPVIIEVNDFWDETGQLFLQKGWKREIEECYTRWKQYYRLK